jgi:flagellar protein FliL
MAESTRGKEGAAPPKRGKTKLLLAAGAGLLLLAGGGGGAAFYFGLLPGGGSSGHSEEAGAERPGPDAPAGEDRAAKGGGHGDEEGRGDGEAPAAGVIFVDVPDMLVNLQPDGKRMRFLRLRLALEAEDQRVADGVKALMPRVLDSFQMYLRALTIEEVQGSAGMQRLKEEMVARVNLAIEPERVRDVLVREMLVQ